MSKDKAFSLDRVAGVLAEFRERKARMKADKKWTDEVTGIFKDMAGDAKEFTVNGAKVAMLVPGQLNQTLLAKEQPEIVERFTYMITERKFDPAAFAQAEPELFEQYRAQRLVLSDGEPPIDGLQ